MDTLASQLKKFGKIQLASVSAHDIRISSVHLILTVAFFTGAILAMAKAFNAPKKIYLKILYLFLEENFGLSNNNASGMIESNARLYKRYVLVEKIYNAGWEAAENDVKAEGQCHDISNDISNDINFELNDVNNHKNNAALKDLLYQYHDLSMSELNIEGSKEQKVETPKIEEIEPIVPEPIVPVIQPRKSRKFLLFLIVILLTCGGYYFIINPFSLSKIGEQSPILFLQHALEEASKVARSLIQQ